MLSRVLEPEVMDTAEEANDYDSMDHSEVNRRFVDDWEAARRTWNGTSGSTVRMLDVGTGTALIPIEFCRRDPTLQIVAIDLAEEMLKLGQQNIQRAGFSARIELLQVDAKSSGFRDREFDAVVSNSIIHHIPDPLQCFVDMVRVLKPGGILMVRDLLRPETAAEVEALVGVYTSGGSPRQQQLFRQSLHAALTVDEVAALLDRLGLPHSWVRATSDRHWTVLGRLPESSAIPPQKA